MKLCLLTLMFVFLSGVLPAQSDICRKSTEGTEFWFGFMESRNYNPDHFVEITVTARETTTFQIKTGPTEIPLNGTYLIEANSSVRVKIPWEMVEATGSEEVQDKGVLLESEKPVNVYALNWDHNSADVAVIYPTGSLGTEYFAMCYYPDIDLSNPFSGNGRNSEFLIVAAEDGTLVEITPSRVTDKGIPKDSTFTVLLNRGQTYQVQSENIPGSRQEGQGDLTGSHIRAGKPVAFYSGSLSTRIPQGQCCWDHIYEQIPPIHSWGMEYYLAPLKSRESDRYRILAANDNTIVHITGRSPVILHRGEFYEMVLRHNDPVRVLADKPVLAAQFSQSRDVDTEFTGGDGDPFMIILSPVNQTRNDVTFVAYESPDIDFEGYTGITKYFVNIIAPDKDLPSIRLNDEPVTDQFIPFPGGNYSYAQIEIEAGTHRLNTTDPEAGFLSYVYGFGGVESYGYGVGFNLDLTLDLGESIFFEGDTLLLCFGDTLTLNAGPYFDSYLWDNGLVSQLRPVYDQGWYHVKTTTIDGCVLEDSVFIFISRPETNLGTDYAEGCHPFSIQLSAEDGYQSYLWQDESGDTLLHSRNFTASATGIYSVTVFDKYGCSASDTMELTVFPVPETTISGPAQVCGEKTASLEVIHSGTADSIWNYANSFEWTSGSPALSITEATHSSATVEAASWGDFEIYYRLTTIDSCETTDTIRIRFHPMPQSDFRFETDERCDGYSQILTFTGAATDSADFHWDLNGSSFLDTLDLHRYVVSIGAYLDSPPAVGLFINDNGCISDTLYRLSGAKPNFTMDASPTRGCDNLTVNFNSSMLTDDEVVWEWEFHDGTMATEEAVTKAYGEPGFYSVSLTVTNPASLCTNSFSIDSMVKVFPTPVAEISADPAVCHPDTVQLSYSNSIDSSLCYWEFNDMHPIGGENDKIIVAFDNPEATVKLTVSEFGCVSAPVELKLKRKPVFNFVAQPHEGCQPFSTEIYAETTDSHIRFEWITDSLPYPTGNTFTFFADLPGTSDIKLAGHSMETGCSDTLLRSGYITIHPKPTANFRIDYPVAMIENARITFTNRSSGAENYLWDFGDGYFSDDLHVVHTYKEPGDFNAQLIAETDFGCLDTTEAAIRIIPSAVYTPNAFRPSSSIPENRTFMPVRTGIDPYRFRLTIYDRQGQVVYETSSPANAWDGNLPDGKPARAGNYIWIARYFDIQGFEREQKGQVLLIR